MPGREPLTVTAPGTWGWSRRNEAGPGRYVSPLRDGAGPAVRDAPPRNRFRPNVVMGGTAPRAAQDRHRVRCGEAAGRAAGPGARCVIAAAGRCAAGRGEEPRRTLPGRRRSGDQWLFGQILIPREIGTIPVGDPFGILG
ncbi:MOSC domain-containing protein [Streptomyces celluloflavus]